MNKAFLSAEGRSAVLSYYEDLIKRLGAAHERIAVKTRYGDTSLIAAGDPANPALILLHGSSMNAAMWIGDIPQYAEHFRVYAPDIPGEPGYSDEGQLPLDTGDYAEWLLGVMDALGVKRAALVGASLGGFLAVKFASAHPERVTKLALLAPAGIGGQNEAFGRLAMKLLPEGEAGVDALLKKVNGGSTVPEVILRYQKLIAFCFNARKEPIPIFTDEALMRLTMPGIVFVGLQDIMLKSDETAARVKALLNHFEVIALPDLGHSLAHQGDEIRTFLMK